MRFALNGRDNFSWLLLALVLLLFFESVFAQFEAQHAQRLVNITLMVTIVLAVWSVEQAQSRWLNWKIGMSLIIASLMISDSLIESNFLAIYQLGTIFLFLVFTLFLCWKQVMFVGAVDGNKIIGSICIYILLGLIWAFAYLIVEHIFPGSFKGLEDNIWQHNLEELTYYSLVTLTTIGYGDITPTAPLARFLAYMEGITGIFYTTILVASLIGMRLAGFSESIGHSSDDRENTGK